MLLVLPVLPVLLVLLSVSLTLTHFLTHSHTLSILSFRTSAQEQGIPEGFTRVCDTPKDSPPDTIRGFKASLYKDQCWKKMPEKDTEDEESGAKTAYASVGVVLATVGSSVLLLCCSHM